MTDHSAPPPIHSLLDPQPKITEINILVHLADGSIGYIKVPHPHGLEIDLGDGRIANEGILFGAIQVSGPTEYQLKLDIQINERHGFTISQDPGK